MSTSNQDPKRGEIWRVDLNPTVGAEMRKIRPSLVVSSDAIRKLPLRLIAPITGWEERYIQNFWHVRVNPDNHNGLSKPSTVDALQLRGVDLSRFVEYVGRVSAATLEEAVAAIAAITEYQ